MRFCSSSHTSFVADSGHEVTCWILFFLEGSGCTSAIYHQQRRTWNCYVWNLTNIATRVDGHARGDTKLKVPVILYVCPEQCCVAYFIPSTPNCYKTAGSNCVSFGPTSGTVAAYPLSLVAMGGSRRPKNRDEWFLTVRDGELNNAQSALKAWGRDVRVLHSELSQSMLFLGHFLVGSLGV